MPDWNSRALNYSDGLTFCTARRIILLETDLITDSGEYRLYKDRHFIFLHKFIDERFKAWVLWHEIAHFILHPVSIAQFSDSVTKRKIEKEANFVSAIALMPASILLTKTLGEVQEEYGYPTRLIYLRKWIYDSYRV